jgi:exoribonuclease II
LWLAIHIADPTHYIHLRTKLWDDIMERTTTKYPSNRRPIHMMPAQILTMSSLMQPNMDIPSEPKRAITILTEINKTTYEPIRKFVCW